MNSYNVKLCEFSQNEINECTYASYKDCEDNYDGQEFTEVDSALEYTIIEDTEEEDEDYFGEASFTEDLDSGVYNL